MVRLTSTDLSHRRDQVEPGDVYQAHNHGYHKVIVVLTGSITFGLPAGVVHDAVVGPDGVTCFEDHRQVGVVRRSGCAILVASLRGRSHP